MNFRPAVPCIPAERIFPGPYGSLGKDADVAVAACGILYLKGDGIGTAIAAEIIEACKYARCENPYEGTIYHGHFSDAEVRTLGVPLVTRDIPGFVVMIGPAPSKEEALEIVKGYQTRGIFVFLIGGIIDQLVEAKKIWEEGR